MKRIAIGSDHGGFHLKGEVMAHLKELGCEVKDYGTYSDESCDYPDYAALVGRAVASGECECGILICGTGIGVSIAANKIKGIRAACVSDTFSAKMCRAHNNANILCFGERVVGHGLALELVDAYLSTEFEGERHVKRIEKISALER
ncbi:MAG: ribose 5-phosphate isomerase B [Clostridia bacterium]|nr:ribose 5-phosphate isomerase B [Clostridia bacterium]